MSHDPFELSAELRWSGTPSINDLHAAMQQWYDDSYPYNREPQELSSDAAGVNTLVTVIDLDTVSTFDDRSFVMMIEAYQSAFPDNDRLVVRIVAVQAQYAGNPKEAFPWNLAGQLAEMVTYLSQTYQLVELRPAQHPRS